MGTPVMTPIQGTVLNADGRPARGQVVISWPFFQVPGQDFVGGETAYKIVDGQMALSLQSNQDAQPLGMYYTATFELDSGQVYQEYWIVPSTNKPVTMGQCRVSVPDSPSVIISPLQLGSLGALQNQFLAWNGTRWVPQYASSLNFDPIFIGVLIGKTGTDVNVVGDTGIAGSQTQVSLGKNLQLNIPDASPTARGLVTNTGAQTFAGDKTFTGSVSVAGDLAVTGNVTSASGFPVTCLKDGMLVGSRPTINFIPGNGVGLTMSDDSGNERISIIIDAAGGGGGMFDPTQQTGDLIVRGTAAPERLGRGNVGDVLTVVATSGPPPSNWSPLGLAWASNASLQSPWTGNVDAAGNNLSNVGQIGAGTVNSNGCYFSNGVVFACPDGSGGIAIQNVSTINGVIPGLWQQSASPAGAIYYSGGNVGIGTAAPWTPFTVINRISPAQGIASTRFADDAVAPIIWHYKVRGTESNPQSVQVGDWLGYLGFGGYLAGGSQDGASIGCIVTNTSLTADLIFGTNDGSGAGTPERMRITSDGRVGIGTAGQPIPNAKVTISADAGFNDATFHGGVPLLHLQGDVADFSEPSLIFSEINYQPIGAIAGKNTGSGAGDLIFTTRQSNMVSPAERVRIRSTGDVGINTSNPIDPLTIVGMGSAGLGHIRMIFGDYGVLLRNDNASFYIMATPPGNQYGGWSGFLPFCCDLATGRVGIGTNSYINQLTVNGRSSFVAGSEPYAIQLAYNFSSLNVCTYIGTDIGGNFTVSNAGGGGLMQLSQNNWGMTVWGNVNITGQYLVNGAPLSTGFSNMRGGGSAYNQVHTNATGKPMLVVVSVGFIASGQPAIINAYCDTGNPPTTLVCRFADSYMNYNRTQSVHFVVLPGWNYLVNVSGNNNPESWIEWY